MEEPLLEMGYAYISPDLEDPRKIAGLDEERLGGGLRGGNYMFDQRDAGAGGQRLGARMKREFNADWDPK